MKGKIVARERGYIFLPGFFSLEYVLYEWNNIPLHQNVVAEYVYRLKDFVECLRKHSEDFATVWIDTSEIEIRKLGDKFIITMDNINRVYNFYHIMHLENFFSHKDYGRNSNSLFFDNRKAFLRINGEKIRLYDNKITLTVERDAGDNAIFMLPPWKPFWMYNYKLFVTKVNGKGIKYYEKRAWVKKMYMPKANKLLIENRKYQYAFFKMLEKKGVLKKTPISFAPPIYLQDYIKSQEWKLIPLSKNYSKWEFTPLYEVNLKRFSGDINDSPKMPVLVDFDYDNTNQILLKFIDVGTGFRYTSLLCGLDYKDMLWCIRLPGITMFWNIKKTYKYVYAMDESTKIFEY